MEKPGLKKRILVITAVMLAIIAAVSMSLLLKSKIDKAIYEERKEALLQLINLSSRTIGDNVSMQWEIAHVYENDVKSHLKDYDTVENYLVYLNSQIANKNDCYFLVDSIGKYYCSDGKDGKISSTRYYLDDTADELEYLDSLPHFKTGTTYLVLRSRLEEPITVNSVNGEAEIRYCCLMHNVHDQNEAINSLFDGNNNTIIFDTDSGVMLYKQFGIRLLVDGYNVYEKYRVINLEYGADADSIIKDIKSGNASVSMMNLNGDKYYICSSPLNVSNWSAMLVVEGEYFNSTSRQAFSGITASVAVIAAIVAALLVAVYWYLNKLRVNRKILDGELKINEALNEAYRTKSDFLSYMSHDIRTPINGIIGMSDIGIANSTDKGKVEDCFNKIILSGKHLLAIVNDVLDMSAIESGKVVISGDRMNLTQTLSSCVDIIKGIAEGRNLNIEEEYDCRDKLVLGDEFHLKQIVINILSNAVKFTDDGGTVKLSCRQLEENDGKTEYRISISDTGIGMTEEFRKHIFEAFRTATPDGKTRFKGSGLGMAISAEYVKLMKGSISVDSKLNEGSTFTLVIPFVKVTDETEEGNGPELSQMNILVAEDNDINLEITCDMLEDVVKSIKVARDGQQALEMFMASELHEFDLILMDVMMPEMNGLESAAAIRASGREDSDVYIMALTANTYKDDIDAVFASGMNACLNKPFSVEQLVEKMKKR